MQGKTYPSECCQNDPDVIQDPSNLAVRESESGIPGLTWGQVLVCIASPQL